MNILKRKLFIDSFRLQTFFLLAIYCTYVVIDFTTHSSRFFRYTNPEPLEFFLYYISQFANYLDLFIPLTLMLAIIKILYDMNIHNELVALQVAGIRKRALMKPFFWLATILSLLSYANYEYFTPFAQEYIDSFKRMHSKHSKIKTRSVHVISLENAMRLIYQDYLPESKAFFDVFIIKNSDEIWHAKHLFLEYPHPRGEYVDHLIRNEAKIFEKKESYPSYFFSNISLSKKIQPDKKFVPYENRSISWLMGKKNYASEKERAQILTQLHSKCAMPLLSFIIILACAPFCMRFSRSTPIFTICTLSLFSFVAFFTIIDSAIILGENRVVSPLAIIWTPILLLFIGFGWNYWKET